MGKSLEAYEGLEGSGEALRRIIGAAICSLIAHLVNGPDPFIVGGQYPDTKLLQATRQWLTDINFSMDPDSSGVDIATEPWRNMCKSGVFSGEQNDKNADSS